MLGDCASLVGLDAANKVPACLRRHFRDLFQGFLEIVLAKIQQASGQGLSHPDGGMFLANGENPDVCCPAATSGRCCVNSVQQTG